MEIDITQQLEAQALLAARAHQQHLNHDEPVPGLDMITFDVGTNRYHYTYVIQESDGYAIPDGLRSGNILHGAAKPGRFTSPILTAIEG